MTHHPPTAVFDLDGTLADTAPDLIASLNVVLDHEGVPPLSLEHARTMIGAGGRALIARGLEASGREVVPARLDALYRLFLAHYADHVCVGTQLFPNVLPALDRLQEAGFRLAVCTNKVETHSLKLMQALGLAHRFEAICGRDTFAYFKPDPRHLALTVERAGGVLDRAVMIGDSMTDIVTAQAAGVPVVAVTFGYTETPVRELGPDRVIDDFDQLFEAVLDCLRPEAHPRSALG